MVFFGFRAGLFCFWFFYVNWDLGLYGSRVGDRSFFMKIVCFLGLEGSGVGGNVDRRVF